MNVRPSLCLVFLLSFTIVVRCQENDTSITTANPDFTTIDPELDPELTTVKDDTTLPFQTDLPTTVTTPVITCLNLDCGFHGSCNDDDTITCECDGYSRLQDNVCVQRTCQNSCSSLHQNCSDDGGIYNCLCDEGYVKITDDLPCEERTCQNSCSSLHQNCSDDGGTYNCLCDEGYVKITDDLPCEEITTSTKAPGSAQTPGSTQAPEESTQAPKESTQAPKESTQAPEESTQAPTQPPQKPFSTTAFVKPAPTSPSYTGAIVGLFIFLVATCFVFIAVYLVRRVKLRNNYGRLDEDSEGDSGWSAFSKNPIYRGDKDYQPL